MSNSLDFHKLQDADTGYLYAVLNLNNMIPVPDSCITQLKYNQVGQFRSFRNEKEKNDYIYLLQKEKAIIDSMQSTIRAKRKNCMRNAFVSPVLPSLPDAAISNCWKKKAVHIQNKNGQFLQPIFEPIPFHKNNAIHGFLLTANHRWQTRISPAAGSRFFY